MNNFRYWLLYKKILKVISGKSCIGGIFKKWTHKNLWEGAFRRNCVFPRIGALAHYFNINFIKATFLRANLLKN